MHKQCLRVWRPLAAALAALGLLAGCATAPSPQAQNAQAPKTAAEVAKACSASAAGEGPWQDGDVMIAYGDGVLTYGDMRTIYRATAPDSNRPFEDYKPDVRKKFMKEVSLDMLLAREARERGIEKTPLYGVNFKLWARNILPKIWVEEEIGKKVTMPDSEILLWASPALPDVRVRVIVKKELEDAQKVYQNIKSGMDIVNICKTESEGLSQANSCLADYVNTYNYGTFSPPVVQKFLDAQEGDLLPPFYADIGYLVVQVVDKRTPEEITNLWLNDKRTSFVVSRQQEVYAQKIQEIKEQLKVVVHEDVMDEMAKNLQGVQNSVLVEIDGEKFTVPEVLGQAVYGKHGDTSYSSTVGKFVEEMTLATYCINSGYAESNQRFQELLSVNRNMILSSTLKQLVGDEAAASAVTDEQLADYIKANQKDYMQPEEKRLQIILVDSVEMSDRVLKRLADGEDFGVVASGASLHVESAPKGGDIGFFPKSSIPEPMATPAFELTEGQYTQKAVEVDIGGKPHWALIKVTAVRNAAPLGLDSVKKPMLEGRLRTFLRANALKSLLVATSEKFGYANCCDVSK